MIVENHISFVRLFKIIWLELLAILIVATLPVTALIYFDLQEYAIKFSIPLVIGTAIALFLGFRTNSAYERWWEARKLWGSIINDSRNIVRLCNDSFGTANQTPRDSHQALITEIGYRQIAWAEALNLRLKDLPVQGLDQWLNPEDRAEVEKANDPVLMLLARQGQSLRQALQNGLVDTRQSVLLQETLSRLCDHYGGCQRIKGTVFPVHYSFFTRVFIWIFLFLLGFSLPFHEGEHASYALIPAIFLIGWVFFMVEGIGSYMQDPFENNRNVIPMGAMARTIEINLRELMGETDLPQHVQPIEGALY